MNGIVQIPGHLRPVLASPDESTDDFQFRLRIAVARQRNSSNGFSWLTLSNGNGGKLEIKTVPPAFNEWFGEGKRRAEIVVSDSKEIVFRLPLDTNDVFSLVELFNNEEFKKVAHFPEPKEPQTPSEFSL